MAYTFALDTDKMTALATELKTTSSNIQSGIESIFTSIDGMEGKCWSGSSYTTFHDGAHNYKGALDTLDEVVQAFEKELEKLNGPATEAIKAIEEQIGKMSE